MIKKIKFLLLNENGQIIPQRERVSYLKKQGIYNFISTAYDDSYQLNEKIYCLTHNLEKRKSCIRCGKELKFIHGYANHCSKFCASNNPLILEKNRINVSKSLKKAYLENGNEIKEKRRNTIFKKYGINSSSPFKIPKIQEQNKATFIKKYGVSNVFYLEKFRSNGGNVSRNKSIEFNKLNGYEIEYLKEGKIKVKNLCEIHGDIEIESTNFYNRFHRNRNGIKCTICNPIDSFTSLETDFEKLLNDLDIKNYIKNTKKIIYPYELDFYFPNEKIAIELNGIYWHSEIYKNKNYHKIKTDLCKDIGIQLIHIWEDDFYNKLELIKSIISYKFKKNNEIIYARKCNIKKITSHEYRDFLYHNHLQGSINSSIKYGLFFNNDLKSVMGFGKLRTSLGSVDKEKIFELQRFCTKLNTNVIGGASKLFSYFIKNNKCLQIISYAKRDYSIGSLYLKLGFTLDKVCDPGYYWIVDGKRKHRFNFRKNKISNE